MRVGLVGCAKQKRAGTHLARDLYTSRSSASRRVAERTCDEVFILSALHELVDLAQPLRSYDRRLSRLDKRMRALWGARVSASLGDRFPHLDIERHLCAGREYLLPLSLPPRWRGLKPLRGFGIGARLRGLSARARELAYSGTYPAARFDDRWDEAAGRHRRGGRSPTMVHAVVVPQRWRPAMEYIGIDVHKMESQICILTESGEMVERPCWLQIPSHASECS